MQQLVQLQKQADEFKSLNAEVICVYREEQEGVEGLKKIRDRTGTDFTLTLDLDKKSSNAYSPQRGTFHNYVIDKNGVLQLELAGSLKKRATADQLIDTLKKLQK